MRSQNEALPLHDFRVGSWLVQPSLNRISHREGMKHLEPKVMQVLLCLAERPACVIPKDELLSRVWPDTFVSDDVLLRCISELRKALEDDVRDPRFIQTIPKSGYRLVAKVERLAESDQETRPAAPVFGRRSRRRGWWLVGGMAVALGVVSLFVLWHSRSPAGAKAQTNVLAVLPFLDLSGRPDQAFFSDGMTEEMITELGRVDPERLRVIARTSAMQYRNSRMRVDQIGKELGADFVLEGTVRVEQDRARISARLIRTTDQANLWTASYDRKISGILSLQTEVAREVARRISLTISGHNVSPGRGLGSVNPDAYMNYLRGRYHYHKFTTEGFVAATDHFQKAVNVDPNHAPSWLGLADAYRLRGSWWGDLRPRDAFPRAKEAVSRALSLDPQLSEAHAALGWIRFVYDWDWAGAEAEFERAIELNPHSRDAHSPYANYLRSMGRLDEARAHIERSLEIDPLSPLELSEAGLVYLELGDVEKAERFIRQAVEVSPHFPATLFGQAMLHQRKGELDQATKVLEQAVSVSEPSKTMLAHLADVHLTAGRKDLAQVIVDRLLETPAVSAGYLAALYRRMGEHEKALDWLERAYEERDPLLISHNQSGPPYPLWNNPRYQRIWRLMNFPGPRAED